MKVFDIHFCLNNTLPCYADDTKKKNNSILFVHKRPARKGCMGIVPKTHTDIFKVLT